MTELPHLIGKKVAAEIPMKIAMRIEDESGTVSRIY
jgi:hypothetical protein